MVPHPLSSHRLLLLAGGLLTAVALTACGTSGDAPATVEVPAGLEEVTETVPAEGSDDITDTEEDLLVETIPAPDLINVDRLPQQDPSTLTLTIDQVTVLYDPAGSPDWEAAVSDGDAETVEINNPKTVGNAKSNTSIKAVAEGEVVLTLTNTRTGDEREIVLLIVEGNL